MNKAPLVSVVMATYGDGAFLSEAVASIRAQTISDFEFIIVDNGLDQRGREVLAAAIAGDARVRVLVQAGGLSRALDAGCRAARTGLIARFDSDDIALPERLQHQLAFMNANRDCVACGTDIIRIDQSGREIGHKAYPHAWPDARTMLLRWPCIVHAAAMFRKRAYEAAGGYGIWYRAAEDYALWLRMTASGTIVNLPVALLKSRVHAGSVSARMGERQMVTTMKVRAEAERMLLRAMPHSRVRLRDIARPHAGLPWRFRYEIARRLLKDARVVVGHDKPKAAQARGKALSWMRRGVSPMGWLRIPLLYLGSFLARGR